MPMLLREHTRPWAGNNRAMFGERPKGDRNAREKI
jgi:hypothetical protein